MKTFKVLSILALTLLAAIFVLRPFSGQVIGLPSEGEPYDSCFAEANAWFDSVAYVHAQQTPILEKIESKLYYIGKGLKSEKDGKWLGFDTLEKKLDNIVGLSDSGLPPEAVIYYNNANSFFTNVSNIHAWQGDLHPTVKGYFNTSNSYFDTVKLIHNRVLFADSSELWRVEQKLWTLNQALKNEKHAKLGAFQDLEAKLDTLLGREYAIPEDIDAYFDTADIFFDSLDAAHKQVGGLTEETDIWFLISNEWFDSVNFIHQDPPFPTEWTNIEWKIHYLNWALQAQKEGKYWAFYELEAKLDTLLGWYFPGTLNPDAEGEFKMANDYFDSVTYLHLDPQYPETLNIEWKLHYLKHALHHQKYFKWLMFYELEYKLDSLLHWEFTGLPQEVDSLFNLADTYFDSVNLVHEYMIYEGEPESWRVMKKIHYLNYGLKHQKDAMWMAFEELEYKLDMLAMPWIDPPGLPEEINLLFTSSNAWFDSVNDVFSLVDSSITWRVEWMIHYLKQALKDEKDAKWRAFNELKRKAYEFDKLELKLYYLATALKYEKEAKWRMFEELEHKLDDLLVVPFEILPESVTTYLTNANYYFNDAIAIHWEPGIPELEKIIYKLISIKWGLVSQKEATRIMFDSLAFKINIYTETSDLGWDPDIRAYFDSADHYFSLIDEIQPTPGLELQDIEIMIYYLSQGQQFVKQAQEKMFSQMKERLFEFDKIEKKLYNINIASQYAKDAKKLIFEHLELKLDTLFVRRGWEPIPIPDLVNTRFSAANTYFDLVNSVHLEPMPDTTELFKIGLKIHYLKHAFLNQKEATWLMFENLEQKLDSLLDKEYLGLPEEVDIDFDSAGFYFDSVNTIYKQFEGIAGQLDIIEYMLDAFTTALKFAKEAKWLMFDDLEVKIDSLIETDVREVGESGTVPERFVLLQNYPNPFNPTTHIEFMVPEPAQVKLEIYNILGKKIITLVDEKLSAGHKIVEWDGKDSQGNKVSTGIYFYKLKAGDFTQTKKMVLLK